MGSMSSNTYNIRFMMLSNTLLPSLLCYDVYYSSSILTYFQQTEPPNDINPHHTTKEGNRQSSPLQGPDFYCEKGQKMMMTMMLKKRDLSRNSNNHPSLCSNNSLIITSIIFYICIKIKKENCKAKYKIK